MTITPDGNGDVFVELPANAVTDDAGNGNAAFSATISVDVDTEAPTVTSSLAPTVVNGPFELSYTFSEEVNGFTADDLVLSNATAVLTGGPTVFTVVITPDGNGDVSVELPAGVVTDAAGNGNEALAASAAVTGLVVDTAEPTITASMPPASVNGPFDVAFTFSEDVTGFEASDFVVANATVTLSGGPRVFAATITPDGNGDVSVDLPAGVVTDAAGNGNEAFSASVNVVLDTTPPTVTSSTPPIAVNGSFELVYTFSEAVSGFESSDLSLTNATATLTGGPTIYTVTVTPTGGDVSATLPAGAAQDDAGNDSLALAMGATGIVFDNTAPTVSVSTPPAMVNGEFTLEVTFSEDVSGFGASDVIIENASVVLSAGPRVYILVVTPNGEGDITISLPSDIAVDISGNENEGLDDDVVVKFDNTNPLVASISRQAPQSVVTADDSLTWRVAFNEDVVNVDAADFVVSGTTATLSLAVISTIEFEISVQGGDLDDLNDTVTLSLVTSNDIEDATGNALIDTTPVGANDNFFIVQNDVIPPTLTISGVPSAVDGPFTVTFTFSEAVQGFDADDIVVTNGSVSEFQESSVSIAAQNTSSVSGAGSVFTAKITPNGEGNLTISIAENSLSDMAGNFNVTATVASTVIDSTAPSVLIGALPADVRGPFSVNVSFNENVTGFTLSDVSITNGVGSEFQAISESEYTLEVTPNAMGTVTVDVAANVAQDAANNGNTAAETVSTEFIDEVFVRNRTGRIINNFMARRADQITLNGPDLARRLLDQGSDARLDGNADHDGANLSFKAKATGEDAKLHRLIGADAASKLNLWADANLISISAETADSDLLLLHAGVDYRVNDNTLIGFMGQYDSADEKDLREDFEISGNGWMVGPYVVSKLTDNLVFDGRAAWGQSSNEVSPFNTYSDEFDTNRWMLKGQFTGEFTLNEWRVNPSLEAIFFEERQKAYTDNFGIIIPDQTIQIGRLTFGPRFSKIFDVSENVSISPEFEIRGVWDFEQAEILNLDSGLANGQNALRARTEGGLNIAYSNGTRLTLDGFYDGIGSTDFEAYGMKAGVSFPIN